MKKAIGTKTTLKRAKERNRSEGRADQQYATHGRCAVFERVFLLEEDTVFLGGVFAALLALQESDQSGPQDQADHKGHDGRQHCAQHDGFERAEDRPSEIAQPVKMVEHGSLP